MGCSGGLALAIVFAVRALLTTDAPAPLLLFLNEDGSSAAASSSSWTEDSFELRVLLEPFSETETEGPSGNQPIPRVAGEDAGPSHQRNYSAESSLRNRVRSLQNQESPFLLEKEKGSYWSEIRRALDQATSQRNSHRILELENRDLQIRESRSEIGAFFQTLLSENPAFALADKAAYNPKEALIDFFEERRRELDIDPRLQFFPEVRDREELEFLSHVRRDLWERGPDSIYIENGPGANKIPGELMHA